MLEFGWGHLFGNGDNRNGGEKKEKKVPTVRPTIPLVTYPSAPRRRRPLSALSTSISLTLPCNLVPCSLTFPVGLRRLLDECGWSLLWGANGVSAPPFFPRLPSPVSPSPSTHPRRFFHSSEKKPAGRRGVVVNHMLSISAHECGCRDGTRQEKKEATLSNEITVWRERGYYVSNNSGRNESWHWVGAIFLISHAALLCFFYYHLYVKSINSYLIAA